MTPQFNLLRDEFARWGSFAETTFRLDKTWVSLTVRTWKTHSFYHLSKVKDFIPDVYN